MNTTGITWLVITLIIISVQVSAQKVDTDVTLKTADYLFETGQYRPAVKEYQRYLFYSGNEDPEILLKLGFGLYEEGYHDLALQYYEQVYFLTDDPHIRFISRLKEIRHSMNSSEYNQALVSLFSLENDSRQLYPEVIDFLTAVCYFGLQEFEKSRTTFLKIVKGDSLAVQQINELFANPKRFTRPNPKTIGIVSLFIPGLGQFISGEYKEGINSFLLVGGLGAAMVVVILRYSVLDAVLSLLPWYQRYLIGGSDKAEELAVLKRAENRNEVYLEILEVLKPYRSKLHIKEPF